MKFAEQLIFANMSFTKFGKFLAIISSNTFSDLPSFFLSWDSDDINVRSFVIILHVLKPCSFFSVHFLSIVHIIYVYCFVKFIHSLLCLLILLLSQLLVLFFTVIVLVNSKISIWFYIYYFFAEVLFFGSSIFILIISALIIVLVI